MNDIIWVVSGIIAAYLACAFLFPVLLSERNIFHGHMMVLILIICIVGGYISLIIVLSIIFIKFVLYKVGILKVFNYWIKWGYKDEYEEY